MTSVRRTVATATLTALVLAGAGTGLASASTGSSDARVDAMVELLRSGQAPAELDAGYATDPEFAEIITDKLVIPELNCAGASGDIVLIGHTSPSRQLIAGALGSCAFGVTAIAVAVGDSSNAVLAAAGNEITISTTTDDAGTTTATVTNETTGESITASGLFADTSVLLGVGTDPGLQLTDFGKVKLTKNTIDGAKLRKSEVTKYDMVTADVLRAKTGKIKKGSFTITHKAL